MALFRVALVIVSPLQIPAVLLSHASAPESGLLVELSEPTNLVPVQAEFDEPLIPSDYDAYGGYAGIADSSSTAVNW